MHILCLIGIHQWSKWTNAQRSPRYEYLIVQDQAKRCFRCNIIKNREIGQVLLPDEYVESKA